MYPYWQGLIWINQSAVEGIEQSVRTFQQFSEATV